MLGEHEMKVCKNILRHLKKSTDGLGEHRVAHSVYVVPLPPAERLRKEADEIEDRDADIEAFRRMVSAAETLAEVRRANSHDKG